MKPKLILSTLLLFIFSLLSSQVPQGFNYQAIAREGGNPVKTPIGVMLTIQSTAVGGTIFWTELHSGVQPNSSGLFTIVLGAGVRQSGTANTFNDIDWSVGPKYLKTEINTGSGFVTMGTSQFLSVPYSMVADGLGGSLDKLTVAAPATSTSMTEPLFEVKNNTGQTVFAVYNEGVRVYVDNGKKGVKGGFAIGGFGTEKAGTSQPLFIVNADSIRAYINPTLLEKGIKGGFAIGGFEGLKATREQYLLVNSQSAQINMREPLKGVKAGFAIGSYSPGKADPLPTPFTNLTPDNYFIGHKSGIKNNSGIHNSFVGYETGINNTSGRKNVFMGYHAGYSNDTASYNVFIGNEAGLNNQFGRYNSFLGYQAGYNNNTNYNSFIGYQSGRSTTSGTSNVFLGYMTGNRNQSGSNNVYVGNLAGYSGTYVNSNVCLGDSAGYGNTNNYNVFIGKGSGKTNAGQFNTFIGYQTGLKNRTGPNNVLIGHLTGYNNTTGGYNSFIGRSAGFNNISGWSNVFIGDQAGYSDTSASNNICIGESSGYSLKSGRRYNVLIGDMSGKWNLDGNNNVFLGAMSGQYNNGSTNIMIGYLCGMNSGSGSDNIFIGNQAGRNETGSNKLYISNTSTSTPLIGGDFAYDRVGINRMPTTYTLEVGGTIWANGTAIVAGSTTWSDVRYKTDITPLTGALSDVLKMNGIRYNWKQTEFPKLNFPKGDQIGVIAQDMERILPELVYTDPAGYKSVSYEKLTPVLIEAIKEQQQQIEGQQKEINELKSLVNTLIANQARQGNK